LPTMTAGHILTGKIFGLQQLYLMISICSRVTGPVIFLKRPFAAQYHGNNVISIQNIF